MEGTPEVTYMVLVEPAGEQRQQFATWCIAQEPEVSTASHSAFAVPAELFKELPEPLLVGAYVDGHLYRHVTDEQPVTEAAPATLPKRARKRPSAVATADVTKAAAEVTE
jgi:hypothetical protein